ncbi:MAG TPA: hypothetical protein VFC02_25430 [Anaerolineales bacterium]|nr:hypothetical protein [Anaerolineales bacterium]
MIGLVYGLQGLASLYVTKGRVERAARLFAWADAMREKLGDHRPPVEQNPVENDLTVIGSKVDENEFANFSAEGRTMTWNKQLILHCRDKLDKLIITKRDSHLPLHRYRRQH